MYACIHDTGADSSRRCASGRIGHLRFATHPRPLIREVSMRDEVAKVNGAAIISSTPFTRSGYQCLYQRSGRDKGHARPKRGVSGARIHSIGFRGRSEACRMSTYAVG
jgi:hypothetical protein